MGEWKRSVREAGQSSASRAQSYSAKQLFSRLILNIMFSLSSCGLLQFPDLLVISCVSITRCSSLLVGKGDEETSSSWCPVAADEEVSVDAQEANAKCVQHLPPPQASEQLLSEGVPTEDRVSQA